MEKKQFTYEDNTEDLTQPIRPNSIQERLLNAALDKQRRQSEECDEDNTQHIIRQVRKLGHFFK